MRIEEKKWFKYYGFIHMVTVGSMEIPAHIMSKRRIDERNAIKNLFTKMIAEFRHQKLCCVVQNMANKKQIIYRPNRRELIVSRSLSRSVSPITEKNKPNK